MTAAEPPDRQPLARQPLDQRGPDEPRPDRLAPDHPRRAEILAAHRAARISGAPAYVDPATGFLVLTSAELAARGRCCDQGCRHCPYRPAGPDGTMPPR